MTDQPSPTPLRLRWDSPARHWTESTPVGNGTIGAMVFGDARGRFALNDSSVWSGTPDTPDAALRSVVAAGAGPQRLADVREAVAHRDEERAEALLRTFEGLWSQEFLPLGDLDLDLGRIDDDGYERVLDLESAVLTERFSSGGIPVRTEEGNPVALNGATFGDAVALMLSAPLVKLDASEAR